MSDSKKLPYNPSNQKSILNYAQLLIGTTLREHVSVDKIDDPKRRKGSFGNAVEYYFFGYELNSDSEPDFKEAGLELKTTPLKKTAKGKIVSKERLVITMINYMTVVNETFETSHFLEKASDILLISYLYEKQKDPLDYEIMLATIWGLPEEDMPIFKNDWETIVNKVIQGKAHEISGSDTFYLEACTKAANSSVRRKQPFSDIPAKPRAWAIKGSYMTSVSNKMLEKMESIPRKDYEKELNLFDLLHGKFAPFFGMTEEELSMKFGYYNKEKRKPKNLCALITKKILGINENSEIAEFKKSNMQSKTIRIKSNGNLKESVSFPAFDYCELAETDFNDSKFKSYLDKKFLFVIYKENKAELGVYRLSDIVIWQMNDNDLEEAKRCYEEMKFRVLNKRADESVKSSENKCCHVRPHGRNSSDTCMTPYGVPVVKKCFWLNAKYLASEIDKVISGLKK